MSQVNATTGIEQSPKSRVISTKLLASAQSCAMRAQATLEGLGAVSSLLVLTGVAAGLAVSFLSGLMIDDGFHPTSKATSLMGVSSPGAVLA